MSLRDQRRGTGPLVVAGIVATLLLHGGVAGVVWLTSRSSADAAKPPGPGTFVDAQLVRFGKPRDLTFLPHKQGVVKSNVKADIKIAKDEKALPRLDKDEPKDNKDPLKNTRAEMFKNLKDDDRPEAAAENTGSLTGSRSGTATEAKGDPYILELIDKIGSGWTVPTTIKDTELANLSVDACLTIAESGALTGYKIIKGSGNSQFDSSLEATLSTIKSLPAPPDRFRAAASRGRLCPTFSKQ
jgi:hypothetical protein